LVKPLASNSSIGIIDFGISCSLGNSKSDIWKLMLSGDRSKAVYNSNSEIETVTNKALDGIADSIEKAKSKFGENRIATLVGSCYSGTDELIEALKPSNNIANYPRDLFAKRFYPAQIVAKRFGLSGIARVYSTACASSASAMIAARNLLCNGECDAVIVGGSDVITSTVFLGFSALEAVSPEPCIPFSANRKGITLGEGAAFFLISKEDAHIKITGMGESADAHHITAPREDGLGAVQAMQKALSNANLKAEDIDYVNLHGTGTTLNDAMESVAVNSVFSHGVPVSSTKGFTGHTLGAAGAVELAFCCMALSPQNKDKFLPPHIWDKVPDPSLPALDFVETGRKAKRLKRALSNSFAFGGCNVSLIVEAL
jgi:3-oxoacyl-[acyl-carrier-protein] synthase-1